MTETLGSAVPTLDGFDPYTEEFRQNPYPDYRRIQDMGGPVFWEFLETYLVAGHAEAVAVLANPRIKVEPPRDIAELLDSVVPPELVPMQRTMLFRDPPEHGRLRSLARPFFTAGTVEKAVAGGRRLAAILLAGLEVGAELDVIDDIAYPVALQCIADVLGIPRDEAPELRPWAMALVPAADIPPQGDSIDAAIEAYTELDRYFGRLVDRRRRDRGDDLISTLIEAHDAGLLDRSELHAMAALVFISGHDTLVGFIGSAFLTFLRNPDQLALLRADPTLAERAVEEILRYESPLQLATAGGGRWTTRPTEIGGRLIPERSRVLTLVAAANRDPRVFRDPDRFDITRADGRHLALGHGLHYCLGSALVKAEGRAVLEEIAHTRLEFEPLDPRPRWLPNLIQRRLATFPVRVTGS